MSRDTSPFISYHRKRSSIVILYCLFFTMSLGQNPCTQENTLRLNPAAIFSSTAAGRLELCYCSTGTCIWNTINTGGISTHWIWKNVQVTCRQLGREGRSSFSGLGNPILNSHIPVASIASAFVPIYPFTFTCDGTESNLTNCATTPLSIIFQIHHLDVFITCSTNALHGSVKLTGSTISHRGVLEVYQSNTRQWETVCSDNFGNSEANIACMTLGYASGTSQSFTPTGFRGREITTSPSISRIQCTGLETEFDGCVTIRGTACISNELSGVICTANSSLEGTARLSTIVSTSTYQRVEVLYAGRWGTVCNTNWNSTDGQVVCFSLGLGINDVQIPSTGLSSTVSQRAIWAAGYSCVGSETRLQSCGIMYPYGYAPNCLHSNDALLSCSSASSSGLSGVAITGIVFAVVVVVAILLPMVCVYGKAWWKKGIERGWWVRRARTWTEGIGLQSTQQEEQLSTQQPPPPPPHEVLNNTEFSKPPPPSYDDALQLQQSEPPPDYSEPTSLAPYPVVTLSDSAYPPQAPVSFEYQGYPPPTHTSDETLHVQEQ